MSENNRQVRSVLLAHFSQLLLLPNAVMAEVIGYREPKLSLGDTPKWYRGDILWRQFTTPIVRLDMGDLENGEEQVGVRARIAICYALDADPERPYIGFVTNSVPRLVHVDADNVSPDARTEVPDSIAKLVSATVRVREEHALIPDMAAIEAEVLALRS
ncbi:MAG TPA: hypothetical protein ENJ21_05220 [Chromatiaceae bacterium]|nr:hypothetical protein [Chromatiaceae bacterium]